MKKPIRVLHVVPFMQAAGLETFIMNIYRNIDRSKVQFDFLTHFEKKAFYDDEIESMGGKIYRLSFREDNNLKKYLNDLDNFFKEHTEYSVVHGHMARTAVFFLRYAKKYKVPVRIVHSHNCVSTEKNFRTFIKLILLKFSTLYANKLYACSIDAGKYLFKNKEFEILPNAIDTEKFKYDLKIRNKKRKELKVSDKFVIGHVGRFAEPKNHIFILKIFKELLEKKKDAVLLLVGDGPLKEKIIEKSKEMGIYSNIIFLEPRKDVNELYQAMDVFLMPSTSEGLGIVTIEAQTSGLYNICSDVIPNEARIAPCCKYISLDSNINEWVDAILNCDVSKRKDCSNYVIKANYDIKKLASKMEEEYIKWSQK